MTFISKGEYEKTNLGWQLYQLGERINQWWEWQISKFSTNIPEIPSLGWLDSNLLLQIGRIIFWLLLALVLSWIAIEILRFASPYLYNLKNTPLQSKQTQNTINTTKEEWLRRSQQYQQQYNYREACLCLYQAMLILLDERNLIPQQGSRTDGEYWRLVGQFSHPHPYQTLLLTHQSLCFGRVKASQKMWETCEKAYQEIQLGGERG